MVKRSKGRQQSDRNKTESIKFIIGFHQNQSCEPVTFNKQVRRHTTYYLVHSQAKFLRKQEL